MTYSLVNVGVIANDGNGDPLRDAFIIVSDNFSEVNDFIESQVTQERGFDFSSTIGGAVEISSVFIS